MADAHLVAVKAALATGEELRHLFNRIGMAEHPRGRILVAYRNARRVLSEVVRTGSARLEREAMEALAALRAEVDAATAVLLDDAVAVGRKSAGAQADARSLRVASRVPDVAPMRQAVLAGVDAQVASARAALAVGDTAMLLGDEEAWGIVSPAPVAKETAKWLAVAVMEGWLEFINPARLPAGDWYKQAIAAIDERTTECCLRVHGQAVPLEEMFVTLYEPAWADRQAWPPFHWWCRASPALVSAAEVGDELTAQMQEAGHAELEAREQTGARREIHPAHARSKRLIW